MLEPFRWTAAFSKSSAARAMFPVKSVFVPSIVDIIERSALPGVHSSGLCMPVVDGWAFLDGGLHHIASDGYGMTTLHTGWRVIGWQSLRALCEILNLVPPRRLSGEPPLGDPVELLRRFHATTAADETLAAQADLMAQIASGDDLRSVCQQLLGDNALRADQRDDHSAAGA